MRCIAVSQMIVGTVLIGLLCQSFVHGETAEPTFDREQSWISIAGDDDNPCSHTSPCRSFARAFHRTRAGGHISVIDAGHFGSLVITKAISVSNDAAGEVVFTSERTIHAVWVRLRANERAFLRGLTIEGSNRGTNGINFDSAGALHVQDCIIRNFHTSGGGSERPWGIHFRPTGASELYVSDTLIAANGTTVPFVAGGGVLIEPAESGSARVVFNRVRVESNIIGLEVNTRRVPPAPESRVTLRNSIVAANSSDGIRAVSNPFEVRAENTVTVDRSSSVNNGRGIVADGPRTTVRLSNSTVIGNETGLLSANGGQLVYSSRNNISSNDTNIDEPPSGL